MSLFRRREPDEARSADPYAGIPAPRPYAIQSASGVPVNLDTYTRSAASWACVRVLVSTVKKLPVDVVRYQNGTRNPVEPLPQIVARPSELVARRGWVAQLMRSMCSSGNVYGQITAFTTNTHRPLTIEIIDPSRVTWVTSGGKYVCQVDGKPRDVWPEGDLWHKPMTDFLPPGRPYALSPVEQAATSIGTSIAAERFGAEFFRDGAHPTHLLTTDNAALTKEQAQAAKQALMNTTRGNREPTVLGSGWELQNLSVDPKDSQFIDLLRFEVEQACRWWGVPPSMVYAAVSGQNVTYSNVTQADLAYLKHSVDNYLVDIEDAWTELLPAPQVVKFNTSALLRMDDVARWRVHDLRLKNKTTTVNAIKKLEDELPFPDAEYDSPGIPGGIPPGGNP